MIEALNIGPLLVPAQPAAVVIALVVAVVAVGRLAARRQLDAPWLRGVAEGTAWVGVLGARIGYAIANWSGFRAEPWTVIYIWQPGYLGYAGVIAGAGYAFWRIHRRQDPGRWSQLSVMCVGYAAGAAALGAMFFALYALAPSSLLGRGDRIPDFALEDIAGNSVRLSDLAGRGIVLNFWATWCPPCRREMPLLDEVHAEYQARGVTIVGIAVGESRDVVAPFVEHIGIRYPVWIDPVAPRFGQPTTQSIQGWFSGAGLPTTIFVAPDGTVLDIHVGELNRAFLLGQVKALLPP